MATWFDNTATSGALDALLASISSRALKVVLLSNYTQGMTYATAMTNALGEADITSGDFSGPVDSGYERVLTFDGKQGAATATDLAPTDLHLAITDGSATLLAVTDETSARPITELDTLNFPSFDITALQPVQTAP